MMSDEALFSEIDELVESFVARARQELDKRLDSWKVDLSKNECHEVVGALLARQLTLACGFARCPLIWNGHFAPLVLRAMADVLITVVWILQEPVERSQKFINFGLGQEKLHLEHRRAEIEARGAQEGEKEYLESVENWINVQRLTFLTEVNLGSWSGTSTRSMAEQAGCLDFYNYVYAPFSACVHSMWQHIARYNLKQCRNPLHRLHSIPDEVDVPVDLNYFYLSAKYLQKTFDAFDTAVGVTSPLESAFDLVCSRMNDIIDRDPEGGKD